MALTKHVVDFVLKHLEQRNYLVKFLSPLIKNSVILPEEENDDGTSFFAAFVSIGNLVFLTEAYSKLNPVKRKDVLNKVDRTGASVLDRAYLLSVDEADREKIIQFLQSQGAEIIGYKALNYFIERGNLATVETLCRHCTDFSAHNKSGKTLLMVAAETGQMDIVHFLVEKIAVNPREKNNEGETAADFAKTMEHKEVYEYLKKKIADAL